MKKSVIKRLQGEAVFHDRGRPTGASLMREAAAEIDILARQLQGSAYDAKDFTEAIARVSDAAEMLWVVLANVSGGDWSKQSPEWQEAAARWRDNYFAVVAERAHPAQDVPVSEGAQTDEGHDPPSS